MTPSMQVLKYIIHGGLMPVFPSRSLQAQRITLHYMLLSTRSGKPHAGGSERLIGGQSTRDMTPSM
jgi:hypothetical protein